MYRHRIFSSARFLNNNKFRPKKFFFFLEQSVGQVFIDYPPPRDSGQLQILICK